MVNNNFTSQRVRKVGSYKSDQNNKPCTIFKQKHVSVCDKLTGVGRIYSSFSLTIRQMRVNKRSLGEEVVSIEDYVYILG